MTQAFNLSQFANKVNTSGQASLTTAVTGTLPVTNLPTVTVPYGGTGLTTLTANNVILGNGASTPNFVAPSTSGNVLTSNGTTWTSSAPAAGAMTLLGTVSITAVNSVSLGSLTLTSYKALFIVMNGKRDVNGYQVFINATNAQTGGNWYTNTNNPIYGTAWIDLSSGVMGGVGTSSQPSSTALYAAGGQTDISTASTIIYFRLNSTGNYGAGGSFIVYGVK